MTAANPQLKNQDQDQDQAACPISPRYQDLVIGLVYYAGAMGETFCADLQNKIGACGYKTPALIKVSRIIEQENPGKVPSIGDTPKNEGKEKLERAVALQNLGDGMRGPTETGGDANASILASLAICKLVELRCGPPDENKKFLFIIDSLKHRAEVELLRMVYGDNFRLIAIHCSRENRFNRLKSRKFHGADKEKIKKFMKRDEQDTSTQHGQEVRKVFHLADFFIDNNQPQDNVKYTPDLKRFVDLCVGGKMLRPNVQETGMYHAYASAMRSSCLSRQVGAAILTPDGRVLAIGTNEVPKSGGGVYGDGDTPDCRCFKWSDWCVDKEDPRWEKYYESSPVGKPYCHSTRHKHELKEKVTEWLRNEIVSPLSKKVARTLSGKEGLFDAEEQTKIENAIREFFEDKNFFDDMPVVKDVIEYSRSIHAEMDALMSALRSGTPTTGAVLYTSTYPCHNCARHIVAAGIGKVYYLEPFVKSLAEELHNDSLVHDPAAYGTTANNPDKKEPVGILPFTGVGPRLYAELFMKEGEWKKPTGEFSPPSSTGLRRAIQLDKLEEVEKRATAIARRI